MKVAEILRNIASLLDAEEQQAQQQPVVINVNNSSAEQETPAEQEPTVDDDAIGVMVPPLQQKIELIKKSEGVKSVYDSAQEEDELAVLKRQAGIKTAIVADEDEPFEG
jgi:hypothetical protein